MAVKQLTDSDFKEMTIDSGDTVVVNIYTPLSAECGMLEPLFEHASEEHPDILFAQVDATRCPDVVTEFKIMNVPTLLLFRNGELVRKAIGYLPSSELDQFIFD